MITIWGKHAPHIQTFNHTGAGWELMFPCGHRRFITNEAAIDLHVKHALPICDTPNCTGAAPPKPATLARCPTTLSAPGMAIRRCDLPWGHPGDHHDPSYGPWASLQATSPDTARDDRRRQAEADLTSLANGDRLGPDATNNARIVQDRINRMRYPLGTFYTDEKGNPDGGARVHAIVERQKFEASVSESIVRLTRVTEGLSTSLAVRRENEALVDEKLKALKRDLLALSAFVDQVWKGKASS